MWRLLIGVSLLAACKKTPAPPSAGKCTEAVIEVVKLSVCDAECAAGDAEACAVSSDRYKRGLRTRRDLPKAFERAQRGCKLGSASACSTAGSASRELAFDADAGTPDLSQSDSFQQQAVTRADAECTAGRARSCDMISFWVGDYARAQRYAARAVELFRKGCDADDGFACRRLALNTEMGGLGLVRNEHAGRLLYDKACKQGDAVSCRDAFERSAPDEVSAPFLKRGCELGDGDACFLWSLRLSGDEAIAALKRSCEQDFSLGCDSLATALAASGNAAGARQARQAACELDELRECPK